MKKPLLSIIIPTFNRAKELDLCLKALDEQSLSKKEFEILVVNDGSKDKTAEVLKKWEKKLPNLKSFFQKNSGQGKARNLAFKKATGNIILFIGDDIYGTSNFLEEHLKFHKRNPEKRAAALGLTEWYKGKKVNAYMRWLEKGGPQFAYYKLRPHRKTSFWFFYTSNISLKKDFLKKEKILFDTDFKKYGWEDIELGYRLEKNHGLKLIYHPEALAYHDHWMEAKSLEGKMNSIAKNAPIFQNKHPELRVVPRGIKLSFMKFFSSFPFRASSKVLSFFVPIYGKRIHWKILSKHYFLKTLKPSQ